jgi:uncharacterized membrane protein
MRADFAATAVQVLSTALLGLMAGFFFAFWVDVAPAMRELDAAAYIKTQQAINRVVRNAAFGSVYVGAAAAPVAACLLLLIAGRGREAALWLGIGLTYLVGVFWLTREINVPINNALAGWNPAAPPPDWAMARDRWNDANLVRGIANVAAFMAAVAALAWRPRRG